MDALKNSVKKMWQWRGGQLSPIVQGLCDYIKIPNSSPAFFGADRKKGEMLTDSAVDQLMATCDELFAAWSQDGIFLSDIKRYVLSGPDKPIKNEQGQRRTPAIIFEVPAFGCSDAGTTLLYGHLDKQPGLDPSLWTKTDGPHSPKIIDDKLYGRGGADDGYCLFSALSGLAALRQNKLPHQKALILIESCEESDSADLEFYISELVKEKIIDELKLIVCLDSGCGNYETLWLTNSLRGCLNAVVKISVLNESVHSGDASGIVPSSFRIFRKLLSRLENEETGEIISKEFQVEIPRHIEAAAQKTAPVLLANLKELFPFSGRTAPVSTDLTALLLNRTWCSQLAVIGLAGLPGDLSQAGNAMLPFTEAKISLRIPPTLDAAQAMKALEKIFTEDPPYQAEITFTPAEPGNGWASPPLPAWLEDAVNEAALVYFDGQTARQMGEGLSIPFLSMLQKKFPSAHFLVTGVLGPDSNAHGPNEFLHLTLAQKLTMSIAHILTAQVGH